MPPLDPLRTVHPLTGAVRPVTADLLREVYLCPTAEVHDPLPAIAAARGAPWSESHAAAPGATGAAVTRVLEEVIGATSALDPSQIDCARLSESRARRHLTALRDLWRDLGTLPPDVAPLRHVLGAAAADALEPLPVVEEMWCGARPIDGALATCLAVHHGTASADAPVGAAPCGTATGLRGLQEGFTAGAALADPPEVAVTALRDSVAEMAFAAARAQRMLDDGLVDGPEEIGLLVPDEHEWSDGLEDAFGAVGLHLSAPPTGIGPRDPAGEALHLILAVLRVPAPGMAQRALRVLPALRWGALEPLLEEGGTPEDETALARRLRAIARVLPTPLSGRIGTFAARLSDGPIDWDRLLSSALPASQPGTPGTRRLDAVTVLPAERMPWRGVRRLMVMGFAGDRYPGRPPTSPMFLDEECDAILEHCGLRLPTRRAAQQDGLARLVRQLSVASEGIEVTLPRRDRAGTPLGGCAGLSLLARALGRTEAELVRAPAEEATAWPCAHRIADPCPHEGRPAPLDASELVLGGDLLSLRKDEEDGMPTPQSPSRLETLLVSPLAWVLAEMGAVDGSWAPDAAGIMERGSVYHAVFERLFPAGPAPDPATVGDGVDAALAAAIDRAVPFLAGPAWAVERADMAGLLRHAAREWAETLHAAGAEIVATETRLEGEAHGIAVRGVADAILRLRDGTAAVVDYKSGKADRRRTRMGAGLDVQAHLYGELLPGDLTQGAPTVGYLTLGDGRALMCGPGAAGRLAPAAEDGAGVATDILRKRLEALRRGCVPVVTWEDIAELEKAGVGAYAAKDPLVAAFTPKVNR